MSVAHNQLLLNRFAVSFVLFAISILSLGNVCHAGECKNDYQADGSVNTYFDRLTPYPANWTAQDVQEYQSLGNQSCHFTEWEVTTPVQQRSLPKSKRDALQAFFIDSSDFSKRHPDELDVWIWRGEIALKTGNVYAGWEAGQKIRLLLNSGNYATEESALYDDESDLTASSSKAVYLFEELKRKGWVTRTYGELLAKQQRADIEYATKKRLNVNGKWITQQEFDLDNFEEKKREQSGIKSILRPYSKNRTKEQIQADASRLYHLQSLSKTLTFQQKEFLKEYQIYKASGYDPDLKPNSNQIIPDSRDCHLMYRAANTYCVPVCDVHGKNCRMFCQKVPHGSSYYVFHGKRIKSLEGLCPND